MEEFNIKQYLAEGKLLEEYTSEYDTPTAKRNAFAASYNSAGDTKRFREYMEFLTKLRVSGKTNMMGATPYLQAEFNLDKKEARDLLAYWMDSYRNPDLDESLTDDKIDYRFKDAMSSAGFSDDEQDNIMSRDAGSKFPTDTPFGLSGYQKARDLIEKLRKDYRKMSDSDLEKFSKTMIDHFKGL